jgi:hypothetical protein
MCGFTWTGRDDLLSDPAVQIIGYQVCFEELAAGSFLFNHSCEGTFAIRVQHFRDLYDGPIFQERKTGTEECLGYCLDREQLGICFAQCECAYVREIIQIIRNRPKAPALSP